MTRHELRMAISRLQLDGDEDLKADLEILLGASTFFACHECAIEFSSFLDFLDRSETEALLRIIEKAARG